MPRPGWTIMQMDAGLDTGAMRLVGRMPIEAHDTTSSLHDKLAAQGGQLMVQALADIERPASARPCHSPRRRDLCPQDREGREP